MPPVGTAARRPISCSVTSVSLGRAYRETDAAQTVDRRSPIRVNVDIACSVVGPAEGWACDGSADIARQVLARARELDDELPAAVRGFVERACA